MKRTTIILTFLILSVAMIAQTYPLPSDIMAKYTTKIYVDPTYSGGTYLGTYANPYNSISQLTDFNSSGDSQNDWTAVLFKYGTTTEQTNTMYILADNSLWTYYDHSDTVKGGAKIWCNIPEGNHHGSYNFLLKYGGNWGSIPKIPPIYAKDTWIFGLGFRGQPSIIQTTSKDTLLANRATMADTAVRMEYCTAQRHDNLMRSTTFVRWASNPERSTGLHIVSHTNIDSIQSDGFFLPGASGLLLDSDTMTNINEYWYRYVYDSLAVANDGDPIHILGWLDTLEIKNSYISKEGTGAKFDLIMVPNQTASEITNYWTLDTVRIINSTLAAPNQSWEWKSAKCTIDNGDWTTARVIEDSIVVKSSTVTGTFNGGYSVTWSGTNSGSAVCMHVYEDTILYLRAVSGTLPVENDVVYQEDAGEATGNCRTSGDISPDLPSDPTTSFMVPLQGDFLKENDPNNYITHKSFLKLIDKNEGPIQDTWYMTNYSQRYRIWTADHAFPDTLNNNGTDEWIMSRGGSNGMVQAATSNTITIESYDYADNTDNDFYDNAPVLIVSGTGALQAWNRVESYNPTTHVLTMADNWEVTPSTDSKYAIGGGMGGAFYSLYGSTDYFVSGKNYSVLFDGVIFKGYGYDIPENKKGYLQPYVAGFADYSWNSCIDSILFINCVFDSVRNHTKGDESRYTHCTILDVWPGVNFPWFSDGGKFENCVIGIYESEGATLGSTDTSNVYYTTEPDTLSFVDYLNHDYRLTENATSLVDQGGDYGIAVDYLGNPRDAQPDIGAFEFFSGDGQYNDTIYIDPTWAGTESGTISEPYNSWADANTGSEWPDSTVYLMKRGTVEDLPVINAPAWGKSILFSSGQNNIKIGAYGTGAKPMIRSNDSGARILRFNGCDNVIIENIEIVDNSGTYITHSCIAIPYLNTNVTIDSVIIHGSTTGIIAYANTPQGATNVLVNNCVVYDIEDDGMFFEYSDNVTIDSCYVYDVNQRWTPGSSEGDAYGDGIQFAGYTDDFYVGYTTIDRRGNGNKFTLLINEAYGTNTISGIIEHNTFYGSDEWGDTYERPNVYLQSLDSVVVRYNTFINADSTSALFTQNSTILNCYYNLFIGEYDDNRALILAGGQSYVNNNVFYGFNEGWGAKTDITARNNIIYNYTDWTTTASGDLDYNLYYPTKDAQDDGTHSFADDPDFTNPGSDFTLLAGSPAIDAGVNVGLTVDLAGTAVSNPPEIGAYEYDGGCPVPSAPVIAAESNVGYTSFQANWNSAATATGYYLYVSLSSDFSTHVSGYNGLDVGNQTYYTVTPVDDGQVYYYRVKAYNACGPSVSYSAYEEVTTDAIPEAYKMYIKGGGHFIKSPTQKLLRK